MRKLATIAAAMPISKLVSHSAIAYVKSCATYRYFFNLFLRLLFEFSLYLNLNFCLSFCCCLHVVGNELQHEDAAEGSRRPT